MDIKKTIQSIIEEAFGDRTEKALKRRNRAEKVHDIMETDLIEQDFFKNYMDEHSTLDYDFQQANDLSGNIEVWVDINMPKAQALAELDANYTAFAQPFERWAESHGLYYPEILSTDNSIMFQVTV